MKNEIRVGSNRTGMKASPTEADEMLEIPELQAEMPVADPDADTLRELYRAEAVPVGTVPPAATISGVFSSVVHALSGQRMPVLLDKLGERAAFERTGTRLYDAMLVRLAADDGVELPEGMTLELVQQIRNEEAQHFAMVVEAIEQLGGDPTTQTPCADLAGVQGMGLLQAMADPRTTLAQALQTLLTAELTDNASWELLIDLCEGFGLDELQGRFSQALRHEEQHLLRVRAWLSATVRQQALGRPH